MPEMKVYHNGAFVPVKTPHIYHGGSWVTPKTVKVWHNGAWVIVWQPSSGGGNTGDLPNAIAAFDFTISHAGSDYGLLGMPQDSTTETTLGSHLSALDITTFTGNADMVNFEITPNTGLHADTKLHLRIVSEGKVLDLVSKNTHIVGHNAQWDVSNGQFTQAEMNSLLAFFKAHLDKPCRVSLAIS